jgi:hypothetical protein
MWQRLYDVPQNTVRFHLVRTVFRLCPIDTKQFKHLPEVSGARVRARGGVVLRTICYKPGGRGFDTQWGEFLNFKFLNRTHDLPDCSVVPKYIYMLLRAPNVTSIKPKSQNCGGYSNCRTRGSWASGALKTERNLWQSQYCYSVSLYFVIFFSCEFPWAPITVLRILLRRTHVQTSSPGRYTMCHTLL